MAQGAAIHAAILEAKYRGDRQRTGRAGCESYLGDVKQDDVNSHGLGVVARNPKTGNKDQSHHDPPQHAVAGRDSQQTFHTNEDGQQRVTVRVIEGDAPDPDACSLIGNCTHHRPAARICPRARRSK